METSRKGSTHVQMTSIPKGDVMNKIKVVMEINSIGSKVLEVESKIRVLRKVMFQLFSMRSNIYITMTHARTTHV